MDNQEQQEQKQEEQEKYLLLFSDDTNRLNTLVNNRLNSGYVLYGYPFRSEGYRYQAVILKSFKDKEN